MSTITTRSGKGSALNHAELDSNFKTASQSKTSAYTVLSSDNQDTIECSGTFTVTLPDTATVIAACDTGDFEVTIKNTGSGTITIGRTTGADTIDGAAADIALIANEAVLLKANQAGDGYIIDTGNKNTLGLTASPSQINDVVANNTGDQSLSDFTTATSTELEYNDGVTLGTVLASKTVTADSSGNVNFPAGTQLQVAGTDVFAAIASFTVEATPVESNSKNIASVVRIGTGYYQVTLSNAMTDTDYGALLCVEVDVSAYGAHSIMLDASKTTTVFDIFIYDNANNLSDDPSRVTLQVIGSLA